MEGWIGVAGVIAGALIAFGGQHFNRRSEIRERTVQLLLEQFSLLVALSEDYRNRVWEERKGLSANVVSGWDLQAYRMAEARVRILCRDERVIAAVRELKDTGVELGKSWRLTPRDEVEIQAAWDTYKEAISGFITVASGYLRSRRSLVM